MKIYKIKYSDGKKYNKYFVVSAKNSRESKSLFKKTMPATAKMVSKPASSTKKFIKNSSAENVKNIDFNIVPIPKKYVNEKGRFVSFKDVENIKRFYSERLTEDERKRIDVYNEIKMMDKKTFVQKSEAGSGMIIDKKIMYIAEDLTGQTTVQITVKQRLAAAKQMNSKYLIKEGSNEVYLSLPEFKDVLESKVAESRDKWKANTKDNPLGSYYKTVLFLKYDRATNTVIFDTKDISSH
tara:strand:+ start:132 stop:848 length:717 start_codon:yes stop_codon:yes gene_type:complete